MGRLQVWPPRNQPLTFIRGMDDYSAPNQLPFGAHVLLKNVELSQKGGVVKRWGYTTYGGTQGTGGDLGMHELVRNDDTRYLLRVADDGLLYKKNGESWTNIPIRLASPYGVTATNGVSGAVGVNLATATKYQYAIVAVLAANKTLDSTNISSTSGEVTTGGTAYPIAVSGKGVYGATTYEVWRRTYSGSYGAWGRMTTGLTHTTSGSATTVTYTDDGNTIPDTGQTIPASNTTVYTLSLTQRVDWVNVRKSGNNVTFFANGNGVGWTDGTNAQLLQPATTDPDGAAVANNKWWDVTDPIWSCRGIHSHHRHGFLCDAETMPQRCYFTDGDDNWEWVPQTGFINNPFTFGGRILDFVTKDDSLVMGTTTGIDVLWGHAFDPSDLTNTANVYFSHASDQGVISERSMTRGPGGSVIYLDRDRRLRELLSLSPVKEQVVERELPGGQAVRNALSGMTDAADAAGYFDGDQYMLAFPDDIQVVRVYFFNDGRGRIDAPVVDLMPDGFSQLLKLKDGTLIASDSNSGQLFELYKSEQYTDNGTTVTMTLETASFGLGYDLHDKQIESMYLVLDVADGFSLSVNVYVGSAQAVSTTVTTTVTGSDGYAVADASSTGATYDSTRYSRETVVVREVEIGDSGHFVAVTMGNEATDERPVIYGMYFEFVPDRRPSGEVD